MSAKLDIITLRGLTAEGIHGVFEFEHAAPQPFVIDIALWVDTTDAITSDDIADTVSYADVANDVVGVVEGPPAHLIETLAQRISDVLLANPRVEGVEVTVHKPKAPLEQEFTDVAITVRRGHTPGTILRIRDITVVDGKVAPEADEPLVSFGGPDEAPALPSLAETPRNVTAAQAPVANAPAAQSSVTHFSQEHALRAEEAQPHSFVLALGGNVGDVPVTLAAAVSHLIDIAQIQIHDVSPLLRTHAVLAPGQAAQDDHWNAVILGSTTLTPHELLAHTAGIEAALGRERHEHWGPRRIDIDIITMGHLTVSDATLTIPHPRAHLRAFVLAPWLLVDPEATLPGFGSVDELLSQTADLDGIVDAVDDWLESPEGIQDESDALVAAGRTVPEADSFPAEQSNSSEAAGMAAIPGMADPARPLVIPPIAVPEVAEPLALSRLDRLDPSSKASLQPDHGADLLWHKVWNSWAQTPIEPEDLPEQSQAEHLGGSVIADEDVPQVSVPAPAVSPAESASSPSRASSLTAAQSPAPAATPPEAPAEASSVRDNPHRLDFVISPDKAPEGALEEAQPPVIPPARRTDTPAQAAPVRSSRVSTGPAIAQPLPFQQVLVDDVVLEENPGHRPMQWAPIQSYDGASDSAGGSRSYSTRMVPHSNVPHSQPDADAADEARARAELERIEAQRAEEARQRQARVEAERREQEALERERLAREQRELAAQEAARIREEAARAEAVRAQAARIEAERIAAAARAAAEREAARTPLPKRTAQYAPLPEDGARTQAESFAHADAEGVERPLPQWDFSRAKVTIVDDSADNAHGTAARASVLAPDLPEGTLTGAVAEAPTSTGMVSRVTMRPTATGMIPVVKRDTQHP